MATILPQTSTRYYRSTRVVSNPTALGRRRFLRTEHSSRARSHVWVCCASSPDADIHIRPAELIDYWPAADLHCRAFSPEAEKHDEWEALSLRVDRIAALCINDRLAREGSGKSVLLLAFDGAAPSPALRQRQEAALAAAQAAADTPGSALYRGFPSPLWWLARDLAPGVMPGVGITAESYGLLGVAAVDTFCDHVPPRELDWRREGAFGWYRREGICYVSNVAVAAAARRRGVARRLMAAAEALAAEWDCRAVGLHCNRKKEAPWALYSSLGYRDTGVLEHPIMPYLHGRPPDRCAFRLKLVPGWGERRREEAAAAGKETGAEAGEPGAGAGAGALAG